VEAIVRVRAHLLALSPYWEHEESPGECDQDCHSIHAALRETTAIARALGVPRSVLDDAARWRLMDIQTEEMQRWPTE